METFSLEWFFQLLMFVLPTFITNSSAVYFDPARSGGKGTPSDLGVKFIDNRDLLGPKSLEGAIASILLGTLSAAVLGWMNLIPLGLSFEEWVTVAFFMAVGMHVGDRLGSFIKRRLDIKSGEKFEFFDQLGFIIVALAFASAAQPRISFIIGLPGYVAIILATYFVHVYANRLAFMIGLKKVPW